VLGPCVGAIDPTATSSSSRRGEVLRRDVRQLRGLLQRQMHEASEQKHYEAAAKARDGLDALERAASVQNVVLTTLEPRRAHGRQRRWSRAVVRFRVRFGRVIGRSVHLIDRSMDESDPRYSRAS